MRKWIIGVVVLAATVITPAMLRAHEGHAHKVMGTVSSVDGNHLMVKTTGGKTVMVMLDEKTKVTQGKTKIDAAALKVGDRVVAVGPEENEIIIATTIKIGLTSAASTRK